MDIRRPFEVGPRINDGHIVIAGNAGGRDKAGKVAANNDDTRSVWGHGNNLQTVGRWIGRDYGRVCQ